MTRTLKIVLSVGVALAGVGVAAGVLVARDTGETARIEELEPTGHGPLDGRTFTGMLGPEGQPKDVADTFVFESGTFVSKECEARCNYPARPYQATRTENGWTFTSTTRCPGKNAAIVWNGKVTEDTISGVATWTLRRWYWTLEREFTFEATLQSQPVQEALVQ